MIKLKKVKVKSITHLKELTKDRAEEFIMLLNYSAVSRKRIEWDEEENKFWVPNYIDSAEQMLSESDIEKGYETNIGEAIIKGAFYMEIEEVK